MRIGIDARMLGKGYGLGRYVEQLLLHVLKADHENEYVIFVQEEERLKEIIEIEEITKHIQIVEANIPWYSWKEQVKLVPIIKKAKLDLMHFPHWNVPLFYNDPFIVTIHDLTMYHYPRPEATTLGPVIFWIKDQAHRMVVKHAVNTAKYFITTSEFTKMDVHETLGVRLDRMTTVYQEPFINQKSKVKNQKSFDISTYGIDNPYVLYVGAAYPHKNVEGLLKAWKMFEEKYGSEYQLVLVGKEDVFWNRIKNSETMKQCNNVTYLGFVSDDTLETLYRKASLFVFPSLYEGFGLPPLEAIVREVPVVSSHKSCLPEVVGEGALYFDPENYAQMSNVMYTVLKNEDIRYELRQKGKEELSRYSWQKAAEQMIKIYTR